MNKNNPVNSVYLTALAVASLVMFIDSLYQALVFTVVVVSVFLFATCIVAMIEKIADKNVRFLVFALICSGLITILKVVFQYVNIELVVLMSEQINIAVVPCLLIGIVPIYFEDTLSVKQFFTTSLMMCVCVVVMLLTFGAAVEVIGYGSIIDKSIGAFGVEFFKMPYGKFLIIALLTVACNMVRRAYLKSSRKYRMMVEKYKIEIREIRSSAQREAELKGDKK